MTERMVWHGLWLPWSSAQMQHILFRNTACLRRAKHTYNNDSGRITCNLHGVYIDTSSVRSLSARLTTKMSIYASNHLTKWPKIEGQGGVSFSSSTTNSGTRSKFLVSYDFLKQYTFHWGVTLLLTPCNSTRLVFSIQYEYLNKTNSQLRTVGSGLSYSITRGVKADRELTISKHQSAVCHCTFYVKTLQKRGLGPSLNPLSFRRREVTKLPMCCPFQLPNQLTELHETERTYAIGNTGALRARVTRTVLYCCVLWKQYQSLLTEIIQNAKVYSSIIIRGIAEK